MTKQDCTGLFVGLVGFSLSVLLACAVSYMPNWFAATLLGVIAFFVFCISICVVLGWIERL